MYTNNLILILTYWWEYLREWNLSTADLRNLSSIWKSVGLASRSKELKVCNKIIQIVALLNFSGLVIIIITLIILI